MELALAGIGGILDLVCFVCYIIIIVRMFQNEDGGLGIVCIVTFFLCGVGALIAFVTGWQRKDDYDANLIMIVWSVAFLLGVAVAVVRMKMAGAF